MTDPIRRHASPAARTVSTFHFTVAGLALVLGAASLLRPSAIAGLVSIAIADLFVFSLLRCCAIASTPNLTRRPRGRAVVRNEVRWEVFPYLPTRMTALFLLPVLLCALVISFAGIYLWTKGGVVDSQTPAQALVSRLDAVYFSSVTITTLGYGDFHPISAIAKLAVMAEVASGVLMLVGALPLLISRLTMWRE